MSSFADHFSTTAAAYAAYRPHYPDTLFAWLASVAPTRDRVWDCGTGSGQAAIGLAAYFGHVVATDPSAAQLSRAERDARVSYAAMTAERSALLSHSAALVTAAQALHWFDRDAFYAEARRVLVPGGLLAVWSYALGTFSEPALDEALRRFYEETVGPFWPPERSIIEDGYRSLELPFDELEPPDVVMEATWTLDQLAGYLSTWSAVQRARIATGNDPLPDFLRVLAQRWGANVESRTIRWPLAIRVGRTGLHAATATR
ncbi:MAG: Methyltransferase type 11 [Gemmatimonadetes bacterium]|nr:Methyltransferase type 11 [Gemmatimonadota bacterium]